MNAARWFQPAYGAWPAGRRAFVILGTALAALALGRLALPRSVPSFLSIPPWHRASRVSADLARRADLAAGIVVRAQDYLRAVKRVEGAEPEGTADPSGLIGAELTPLVTTLGSLEAKRISTNPAWARVLAVRMAGVDVRKGSVVAAGFSGSFPALNLAVMAACQALEADLVAVSSVTASSWGANQAGFTWPEIEARLGRAGLVRRVSVAVSLGGAGDRAFDLEPEGRALAEQILEKSAADLGAVALRPSDISASVDQRLDIYGRAAGGRRIVLYVNVGGTEASLGASAAILRMRSGFLPGVPFDFSPERGLIARFAERGVPVLTLLNVRDLAVRWGVPLAPRVAEPAQR